MLFYANVNGTIDFKYIIALTLRRQENFRYSITRIVQLCINFSNVISFLNERENEGTISVFIADIQLRRLVSQEHVISRIPARTLSFLGEFEFSLDKLVVR